MQQLESKSEVIEFGPMSFRANVRDEYAKLFNRSHALDYMALQDYELLHKTLGRIEIVEALVFDIMDKPFHFHFTAEETQYFEWLKGCKLLRDQFLHELPTKTSLQLQREIEEKQLHNVQQNEHWYRGT